MTEKSRRPFDQIFELEIEGDGPDALHGTPGDHLVRLAKEREEKKGISFSEALAEISKENSGIANQYLGYAAGKNKSRS